MTRRREPLAHSIIFFFSDFVQVLLRRLQQGESQSLKCVRELLYPHADGTLLLPARGNVSAESLGTTFGL